MDGKAFPRRYNGNNSKFTTLKKSYTIKKCHKQSKKPNDDQEIIFSIHEMQSAIIPNIKKRPCNSKKTLSTVEIWAKK